MCFKFEIPWGVHPIYCLAAFSDTLIFTTAHALTPDRVKKEWRGTFTRLSQKRQRRAPTLLGQVYELV
jgi:hypothetical protein